LLQKEAAVKVPEAKTETKPLKVVVFYKFFGELKPRGE
jgi:hypothetical protein